jgi:hypothetical protein
MITPEFLNEIVEKTETTARYMQTAILKRICERIEASVLAHQEHILIPSTITEIKKLLDTGLMVEEIQEEIEKALPHLQKEIRLAFLQSAREISDYNTDVAREIIHKEGLDIEIPQYEQVGLPKDTANLNLTATEVRKLEQTYKGTAKMIRDMCRLLPVQGNEKYLRLATEAIVKTKAGIPVGQAITESIQRASNEVVKYNSGHVDNIEVAIARAVRTEIGKANAQIVLTRCGEMGVGYVKVSEHYGARVTKELDYTNHSYWQGKVYSLDWTKDALKSFNADVPKNEKGFKWLRNLKEYMTGLFKNKKPKYPDFVDVCGYGEMLGISGINCRHTFYPFFPESQSNPDSIIDDVRNEDFYKTTQKQREIERRIRKTKKEIYNLEGLEYTEAIQLLDSLKAKLDRQLDELFKFCESKGLKVESWRLEVSKKGESNVGLLQSKSKEQKHRRLRG